MTWKDERTELLKKLWAEGMSASLIAEKLGDVTREAVMGKVDRLGLAKRETTSRRSKWQQEKTGLLIKLWTEGEYASVIAAKLGVTFGAVIGRIHWLGLAGRGRLKRRSQKEHLRQWQEAQEEMKRKANGCRWPIGDPRRDEFDLCGRPRQGRRPYCEEHSAIAFMK